MYYWFLTLYFLDATAKDKLATALEKMKALKIEISSLRSEFADIFALIMELEGKKINLFSYDCNYLTTLWQLIVGGPPFAIFRKFYHQFHLSIPHTFMIFFWNVEPPC